MALSRRYRALAADSSSRALAGAVELRRDLFGEEPHRRERQLGREPRQRHHEQDALVAGGLEIALEAIAHLGRRADESPAVGQIVLEGAQPQQRAIEGA